MSHPARRAHVLLVDDTEAILDVMRDVLEAEGYRVSVSLEPLDLNRIRDLQPDVIVQDLLFAGKPATDWKSLSLARPDTNGAQIPLILCTAALQTVKEPEMAENLDRLGVRVLLKPFDLDDLLMVVSEALSPQALFNEAVAS